MSNGESQRPPPAPPPPGTPPEESTPLWSGRIRITEEVGRGAMGYVYRGLDVKLRRELAIKVSPLPRDQLPRDQLARFLEEAQITAQLEHPNVVPVHDLGLDPEGRVYFSMKLVRGQSLEAILDKRAAGDPETLAQFGLRRLLDVFLQVCQAVEYAHARGVIHRDVKPGNVMVGDFGEVSVMDWGVAKLKDRADRPSGGAVTTEMVEGARARAGASEPPPPVAGVSSVRAGKSALATRVGTVVGTPAYMSPEQVRGDLVDERADVYALGAMLYEMLSGTVPFADEDPVRMMQRTLTEAPRRPSQLVPATPLALEALALRLLEKDPARRDLSIQQIRAHVQDYIEGVGQEYRYGSLWHQVLWAVGAVGLFAFLVWYLTGQSIATVVALAPPAVLNAVGWFLLVVALGSPLWAVSVALRQSRAEHDRFRPPDAGEVFVSSYLAHRTLSAAVAPAFQLVFLLEIIATTARDALRVPARSRLLVQQLAAQLRAEWAHALVVIVVFLFAYQFLLSTEVHFARKVDRYERLVERPRWEAVWPFFLIVVLLLTLATTDVLEAVLSAPGGTVLAALRQRLLAQPVSVFEMVKTVVFQGTFLLGLVTATLLLAFPFAEVLASLRMAYQPVDEATVARRQQYFLRSMAVFRVARVNWLYGGAMIAGLTAITMLAPGSRRPLVEQLLYILGPSLIGFAGYSAARRYVVGYLAHAPAVRTMLARQFALADAQEDAADLAQLRAVAWRWRLLQLTAPVVCVAAFLLWTGSGLHRDAVRQLIIPVNARGWLLILPYALLVPVLLVRDQVQLWRLRRRAPREA